VPDTARPAPLSIAPAQLPGRQAPFSSFLHVAPPAPDPLLHPSLHVAPPSRPPAFLYVSVQKPPRAPFHQFPPPPSARFPMSDSTAPRRKLLRSHRHPISSVSSAARPPLAKMVVPHRALSLSLSGPQEPSRVTVGHREASSLPKTHLAAAAPPPRRCRATSVRPITPLLTRRMLRDPSCLCQPPPPN
jgi:hypothetical protein